MTSDELNTIVAAVIQALKTNSKTISQLTPVSSLSDDDSIEIGGGKRVTYAVLKSLFEVLYSTAIENGIDANNEIFFSGSKLKMSAVPDELNAALNEYFEACVRQDSDHLVDLLNSRIVLLDSMGSDLDGLTYTPVAGDLVWRNGYVFRWDGTAWEDGAVQPRKHVLYINKHTGKRYMWTGTAMQELEGTSSVHVVNNLTTGGEGDALSAEMGKVLKIAVQTLIDSMGEYCFPNGRPTLSWEGPKADIIHTFNNSHVTLSNTALRVDIGSAFEATLGTDNNLYIIDDDSVVVKMGGNAVANAYNPSTGKITIAAVTDVVEITANAITYVGYGEQNSPLVSMFDGLNRGGTTGQWKDTQEPNRVLTLVNCTENTDNVQLNGTDSTAFCTNSSYNKIAVKPEDGTIEAVIGGMAVNSSTTFANPICNGYGQDERLIDLVIMYSTVDNINRIVCGFCQMKSTESSSSPSYTLPLAWDTTKSTITAAHLSVSDARAYIDGVAMSRSAYFTGSKSHADSKFGVISYYSSSGTLRYSAGKMYCARIYSRQLSADEVAQNYKVDQKRFNLT